MNKLTMQQYKRAGKDPLVELLLCFFLGILGIHKFYMGKIGMGILYFFTGGLWGIGTIIDFFTLLVNYINISKTDNTQPVYSNNNSFNYQEPQASDELKKYKELLDMGAITQEEFDEKKKQILGS